MNPYNPNQFTEHKILSDLKHEYLLVAGKWREQNKSREEVIDIVQEILHDAGEQAKSVAPLDGDETHRNIVMFFEHACNVAGGDNAEEHMGAVKVWRSYERNLMLASDEARRKILDFIKFKIKY